MEFNLIKPGPGWTTSALELLWSCPGVSPPNWSAIVNYDWPMTGSSIRQSSDLSAMNRVRVTNGVTVVGGQNQVTILTVGERGCFRLKSPGDENILVKVRAFSPTQRSWSCSPGSKNAP